MIPKISVYAFACGSGAAYAAFYIAKTDEYMEVSADQDIIDHFMKLRRQGKDYELVRWEAKHNALGKLINKLLIQGRMSSRQADRRMKAWIRENPAPA